MATALGYSLFAVMVLVMLFIDFRLFSGKGREVRIREALLWSAIWIGLALLFNLGMFFFATKEQALNFTTGYLIERALSMDNIFVFLLIFNFFRIPLEYQQKVLFWGILLALVMRVIFIAAGVAVINAFHGTIYFFGALLLFVGIKMLFSKEDEKDLGNSPILRFVRKFTPVTAELHGGRFFVRKDGVRWATPLFVVFVMIAFMDIVFAIDSIPAILAVTTDPFVVYTSNIFAILGLRALYTAVAALTDMFRYLNVGLCAILVFIGVKMLASDLIHIPVVLTLALVGGILGVAVLASVILPKTGDA